MEAPQKILSSLTNFFSGPPTAPLPRRKPLVVLGYTVANIVKPVLAIATSWWQVLMIRFADRSAKGLRRAPRDVMLADSTEKGKLGAAFGLLQAMDSAETVLGQFVQVLLCSRL